MKQKPNQQLSVKAVRDAVRSELNQRSFFGTTDAELEAFILDAVSAALPALGDAAGVYNTFGDKAYAWELIGYQLWKHVVSTEYLSSVVLPFIIAKATGKRYNREAALALQRMLGGSTPLLQ